MTDKEKTKSYWKRNGEIYRLGCVQNKKLTVLGVADKENIG